MCLDDHVEFDMKKQIKKSIDSSGAKPIDSLNAVCPEELGYLEKLRIVGSFIRKGLFGRRDPSRRRNIGYELWKGKGSRRGESGNCLSSSTSLRPTESGLLIQSEFSFVSGVGSGEACYTQLELPASAGWDAAVLEERSIRKSGAS